MNPFERSETRDELRESTELPDDPGSHQAIQELRRNLRKTTSFWVWLRNEQQGPTWEEETKTLDVSRHGAALRCRHLVQVETVLAIVRMDSGRRANARVRYARYDGYGKRILGVELLDKDNFWGLDWDSSEPEPHLLAPMSIPRGVLAESAPTAVVDRNSDEPGGTTMSVTSIPKADEVVETTPVQEAAEAVVIAPDLVTEDNPADAGAALVESGAGNGEIAPSLVTDESSEETSVLPISETVEVVGTAPAQEAAEVLVKAPILVTDNSAADLGAPPVRAEAENAEIAPSLVIDEGAAGGSAPPANEVAEKEAPQSLLIASRNDDSIPLGFLGFYGLSEQPFDVTPDPKYLYLGQTHREALTLLAQGIQNLRGFLALIAEPGLGKTTLLNKLMEELRDSTRTVFLFQTQCNSRELLRALLSELGVKNARMNVVTMQNTLNEILFQEMLKGRRFVLIVDEAQNLTDSVLETIRLLSDFETTHTKLIQIVLVGQPQLAHTLLLPDLLQLRQRIAVLANLESLSAVETAQYIDHRLRTAGSSGKPIFTPNALKLIGERSKGIPRMISNLCCSALELGYSEKRNPINSEIVQKVAAKSDLESLVHHQRALPARRMRH